jgi:ABC-2 type transport system ATP-binding protein
LPGGKTVINIEQLQVKYGEFTALKINEPITIEKGDRIGIIGSNGAGKSTLIKAVLGLVPYSGKINTEIAPQNMAVHMQENNYVQSMSVKYIIQAILDTDIRKNKKLRELIDFFGFAPSLNKKFHTLSGGQKQRLTIILVLMQDAPITFFDEITSGLDFETRETLMVKIQEWYKNSDNSLCVVTHYYDELNNLTDKLLILEKGQVVVFGKTSELFERYCGKVLIVVSNNEKNRLLTGDFSKAAAPEHLLAFSCDSFDDEIRIVTALSKHNIDYKRISNDIEILYANAIAQMRIGGASNE